MNKILIISKHRFIAYSRDLGFYLFYFNHRAYSCMPLASISILMIFSYDNTYAVFEYKLFRFVQIS